MPSLARELATASRQPAGTRIGATGHVVQVIGPVVDLEFPPEQLPDIMNAVHVPLDDGSTLVLEKHAYFLRDFRGDTIHPSTLEVMHELGLLEALLRLPHQQVPQFAAKFGEREIVVADLSHLPTRCRFIAMMPQWDFLAFLAREAARSPHVTALAAATNTTETITTPATARRTRSIGFPPGKVIGQCYTPATPHFEPARYNR